MSVGHKKACEAGWNNKLYKVKKMNRKLTLITILIVLILIIGVLLITRPIPIIFDGERALRDVVYQTNLGPRVPGSIAHSQAVSWMQTELEKSGWQVQIQETQEMGHPVRNVIAQRSKSGPWIILCAHYDSRQYADQDPDISKHKLPVPGAVLLELARVLPADMNLNIWLVFMDTEDQGNIPGWDWILGSTAFVKSLEAKPDAVILLDMIGDADLKVYLERNSTQTLALEVWDTAKKAGYGDIFIAEPGPSILDDHIPFLQAGIPAIDIIDFEYPYWHTTQDTSDKVSAHSLKVIGDTVIDWLELHNQQ
jgi:glutaminyl-peptide cyclotransferase